MRMAPVAAMKVLSLDVETSDLPRWDLPVDHALRPRICSIGYVLFDPETAADIECRDLVKPGVLATLKVVRNHFTGSTLIAQRVFAPKGEGPDGWPCRGSR